jgi:MFS family permease
LNAARKVSAARACAFNIGIQLVWGAVLAVSLQARSIELAGGDAVRSFSWLAAGGALIATIVQIAAGVLSDRVRLRTGDRLWFYTAGVALAIPALTWFYLASTFAQFVAAFLLLQFAMNVAGGPYQAVIPDFVALERRGFASSWMSAFQSLGNAFGLLVAAAIHNLHLVAAALLVPFVGTYAITVAHLRGLPAAAGAAKVADSRLRLTGPLGALLFSRGLINLGFFTLLDFLAFFVLQSLHVPQSQLTLFTGTLFLTFTLSAVPGAVVAAQPTDRFDKRVAVTVSVATIVVALAVLGAAQALPVAYLAAALAGAGGGAFVTADWALASAVLPQKEMATAMGIWNVATALPQVIAPLVTGPLVTRLNATAAGAGPRGAVILALAEFVVGGAAIWRLPRV